MEKEFFDKHINVSEAEMLKGAIYGQCRIMDKEDVYNWIYEDELKLKKQQEIIDKAIKYIKEYASYINYLSIDKHKEIGHLEQQNVRELLQILEDKEV